MMMHEGATNYLGVELELSLVKMTKVNKLRKASAFINLTDLWQLTYF